MPLLIPRLILLGGLAGLAASLAAQEADPYAEDPYWYHPGHPVEPAEAMALQTAPGFTVERVLETPRQWGSWTALAVDSQGRLIAAAQSKPGLYRITPPALDDHEATAEVERLSGVASQVGWCHGLLYAFGSLYVTVAEENEVAPLGLYRLRDTDGDDQFDRSDFLFAFAGSGEHGPHNIVVGPDGKSLFMICGNGTPLVEGIERKRPVATEGLDHLMPPGFESSTYTAGCYALRFAPDGSQRELYAAGLRNAYDLAFNEAGDLFTFDSDMEWDLGAPWYRPTRICHLTSGAEFGWRDDAAKWPDHYEDSMGAVVDIGPGSPTGTLFGYEAAFPEKYRQALYALDWTFGTVHAVHLTPNGASYEAEVEEFLSGNGLPLTAAVIGSDGAMYLVVGGRRLGSALYRVRYVGEPVDRHARQAQVERRTLSQEAQQRRELEALHGGRARLGDLEAIWPSLGSEDRAIRFAARVALETIPSQAWRDRALIEGDLGTRLTALLALARQGSVGDLAAIAASLGKSPIASWPVERQLRAARVAELVLARGGEALRESHAALAQALRPALEASRDTALDRELSRLLCYLGDSTAIEPLLERMSADAGELKNLGGELYTRNLKYGEAIRDMLESAPLLERMHHAQMLLWMQGGWTVRQRERYFELLADAVTRSKGGYWYGEFWRRIRESALAQLAEPERPRFAQTGASVFEPESHEAPPAPIGPGRDWSVEEAMALVESRGLQGRDWEDGQRAYAAASCVTCHRMGGSGGAIGPDLSAVGRRFSASDILRATIHPDEAISDQFRMVVVSTREGGTLSGRVVSRDEQATRIATNLMRPTQTVAVPNASIIREEALPVSTMPAGLIDPLNEEELLDLMAYLMSGGEASHPLYDSGD